MKTHFLYCASLPVWTASKLNVELKIESICCSKNFFYFFLNTILYDSIENRSVYFAVSDIVSEDVKPMLFSQKSIWHFLLRAIIDQFIDGTTPVVRRPALNVFYKFRVLLVPVVVVAHANELKRVLN